MVFSHSPSSFNLGCLAVDWTALTLFQGAAPFIRQILLAPVERMHCAAAALASFKHIEKIAIQSLEPFHIIVLISCGSFWCSLERPFSWVFSPSLQLFPPSQQSTRSSLIAMGTNSSSKVCEITTTAPMSHLWYNFLLPPNTRN